MAIDVLSDLNSVPIIVGDDVEMSQLQSVDQDAEGSFYLVLDGQKVALSAPASENFKTAKHLLLVKLTTGDEILTARKVQIDNFDEGRDLSADQRNALIKALSLGKGSPREFYTEALSEFRSRYPEIAAA